MLSWVLSLVLTAAPADVVVPYAATPEMSAWAREKLASVPVEQRGQRLYSLLQAEKRSGRIVADKDNSPKARDPKTAADLFQVMTTGSGNKQAGCYELTVLYVALARAVGLDAVGVERDNTVGTGQIGHVLAGVKTARGLELFDLQNDTTNPRIAPRVLDDPGLSAHHYNHLAVAAHLASNYARAREAIDVALRLAPDVPAFLSNRAMVLLAQNEPHLALAEAARVVELAPELALYRYNLGTILLMSGMLDAAIAQLSYALVLDPSYGLAHRDLGWALLIRGDIERARRELTEAARARPTVPDGALYLGLFHVALSEEAAALRLTEKATDTKLLALAAIAKNGKVEAKLAADVAYLRQVLQSVKRER